MAQKSNAEELTRGGTFFQNMSSFTIWGGYSSYKTLSLKWKQTEFKNCNFHATVKNLYFKPSQYQFFAKNSKNIIFSKKVIGDIIFLI